MKGLAYSSLRTGKKYRLINFGEVYEFQLIRMVRNDFELKDLSTLEPYKLSQLTQFGQGPDFEIREI